MTHHESQHDPKMKNREHNSSDEQNAEMRQKAHEATDKARETVSEVAEQAKQQTRELTDTAKEEALSMVESRKSQVTSELHNIAQAFRTSGKELENRSEAPVAHYANTIADRLEDASQYLSGRSVDDLLADAEDFARNQPELFLGGAFGVGLLISRFFKSSGRDYYEGNGGSYYPSRYTGGQYNRGSMRYGAGQSSYRGVEESYERTSDWDTRYSGTGETRTTTGSTQGSGALGTEVDTDLTGASGSERSTTPNRNTGSRGDNS